MRDEFINKGKNGNLNQIEPNLKWFVVRTKTLTEKKNLGLAHRYQTTKHHFFGQHPEKLCQNALGQ
jgi:hypothetical protein